jgi:hypothetical protein
MPKRKDSEDEQQLPAKRSRHCPSFRVACPRDSSSQRETTLGSKSRGSTSRITTLALDASDHRLKAKHKERNHTLATATLPTSTTLPPAHSSEDNAWNEAGLQAEDDLVADVPSADEPKPKRKRNNNAEVREFSITFFSTYSIISIGEAARVAFS